MFKKIGLLALVALNLNVISNVPVADQVQTYRKLQVNFQNNMYAANFTQEFRQILAEEFYDVVDYQPEDESVMIHFTEALSENEILDLVTAIQGIRQLAIIDNAQDPLIIQLDF